jgi:hypothetical protein
MEFSPNHDTPDHAVSADIDFGLDNGLRVGKNRVEMQISAWRRARSQPVERATKVFAGAGWESASRLPDTRPRGKAIVRKIARAICLRTAFPDRAPGAIKADLRISLV